MNQAQALLVSIGAPAFYSFEGRTLCPSYTKKGPGRRHNTKPAPALNSDEGKAPGQYSRYIKAFFSLEHFFTGQAKMQARREAHASLQELLALAGLPPSKKAP